MQTPIRTIIGRVLQNFQQCRNAIEINLRIDPYCEDYRKLDQLRRIVIQNEAKATNILIDRKIEPSLSACSFWAPVIGVVGHLASEKVGQDCLLVWLLRSQRMANDIIRQLNELNLEQKPIRQAVIEFRDSVQEYTESKKLKSRVGILLKDVV